MASPTESVPRWTSIVATGPRPTSRRDSMIGPEARSEEHTSELQSRFELVCRLLLEKKKLTFWALISSNQRFRALEFVLPEKRVLFVAVMSLPILTAKVVGLDVTTNAERRAVRTAVE